MGLISERLRTRLGGRAASSTPGCVWRWFFSYQAGQRTVIYKTLARPKQEEPSGKVGDAPRVLSAGCWGPSASRGVSFSSSTRLSWEPVGSRFGGGHPELAGHHSRQSCSSPSQRVLKPLLTILHPWPLRMRNRQGFSPSKSSPGSPSRCSLVADVVASRSAAGDNPSWL